MWNEVSWSSEEGASFKSRCCIKQLSISESVRFLSQSISVGAP